MSGEPDLLAGRENDPQWVTYLQQMLNYWGYWDGEQDGQWTDQLEDKVKEFQQSQDLVVDGWVGPRTWSVLKQEAVVIKLEDDFPGLAALARTEGNEQAVKQHYANVLEVDDLDRFAQADGDSGDSQYA